MDSKLTSESKWLVLDYMNNLDKGKMFDNLMILDLKGPGEKERLWRVY